MNQDTGHILPPFPKHSSCILHENSPRDNPHRGPAPLFVNFFKFPAFPLALFRPLWYTVRCKNGRSLPFALSIDMKRGGILMANRVVVNICGEEYTFVGGRIRLLYAKGGLLRQ